MVLKILNWEDKDMGDLLILYYTYCWVRKIILKIHQKDVDIFQRLVG